MGNIKVSVIMGSDSDLKVMSPAIEILNNFGIKNEVAIISAHRTPEMLDNYVKSLRDRGVKVVISGAGGAAALPGVIAALTALPVIGVPVKSSNSIDGWDSILSILQMPSGIPVATVALDGAKNAGLLAIRILALQDNDTAKKLDEYIKEMKVKVKAKAKVIKEYGFNAADLD